ncbi:MAG: DUF6111 family protein [Hyphomicrobium sp.]|uniref:DUF6111 family protein n=1 Tax=Hyphomicrobium sp. TaxID=82 RepID=UPI0039E234D7
MIRIVIENVFFFLLPTFLYVVWVAFSKEQWPGLMTTLSEAPLIRLFFAGAALMLGTLIFFSTGVSNNPNDDYVPASVVNGKLEPARSVHEPETKPSATGP